MNALDILKLREGPPFISFGCPKLDEAIGGVPFQGITELSGEAGCGKTQICLALSLQVQLDPANGGRSGAAAYLSCGEGTFPIRRLSQLATCYENRTGTKSEEFLRNVHIEHCYNIEDAQSILRRKIPELCQKQNVKLLIIDSLAGLVRFEFDTTNTADMKVRTVMLFNLAKELKLLSDIFKLTVLVVNQVKADMGEYTNTNTTSTNTTNTTVNTTTTSTNPNTITSDNHSIPALGMAWSYCVNTKISLHRHSAAVRTVCSEVEEEVEKGGEVSGGGGGGGGGSKRSLHDTTSTQYGSGKYAPFSYDADTTTAFSTATDTSVNTNDIRAIKNSPSRANKENTDTKHNLYTIHTHLPKLHDYITYYPINHAIATDTTKSTRYIRMNSSVHKASSVCKYEISQLGVYGV